MVGLSGQNKLGTWRANRGGPCHRMNMNKNVEKESESEKKVRVERKCEQKESFEKRRQKLVPTEEDEKSCHGHISCLQRKIFQRKKLKD